jgi:hypothetical protein
LQRRRGGRRAAGRYSACPFSQTRPYSAHVLAAGGAPAGALASRAEPAISGLPGRRRLAVLDRPSPCDCPIWVRAPPTLRVPCGAHISLAGWEMHACSCAALPASMHHFQHPAPRAGGVAQASRARMGVAARALTPARGGAAIALCITDTSYTLPNHQT